MILYFDDATMLTGAQIRPNALILVYPQTYTLVLICMTGQNESTPVDISAKGCTEWQLAARDGYGTDAAQLFTAVYTGSCVSSNVITLTDVATMTRAVYQKVAGTAKSRIVMCLKGYKTVSGVKELTVTIQFTAYLQSSGGQIQEPQVLVADYSTLRNKPSINSVTLAGNKTSSDLGLLPQPSNRTANKVLGTDASNVIVWKEDSAGVSSYQELTNKPQINSITLSGNKSLDDLSIQSKITAQNKLSYSLISDTPTIPTTLAALSDDQTHRLVTDLQKGSWNGKITAPTSGTVGQYLQKTADGVVWNDPAGGVTSVNTKTGDVVLTASDVNAIANPASGTTGQYLQKTDSGTQWNTITVPVTSVNSKTGDVVLDSSDVGALPIAGQKVTSITATSGTVTVPAESGHIYTYTAVAGDTITFATPTSGYAPQFDLVITMPTSTVSFTFPTVQWMFGQPSWEAGQTYKIKIRYINSTWEAWAMPAAGTAGQVLKTTDTGVVWADQPVILLGPCTGLGLGTSSSGPVFSWGDPDNVTLNGAQLAEWNATYLVRKQSTYPTSYSDGTVVAQTTKTAGTKNYYVQHNFVDDTQQSGKTYKYMLFSQTTDGRWNNLQGSNRYTDGQGLSWSQVQGFVRAGRGAELFPVGTVFYVDHPEYTHTDGTGLWFRVAGHDQVPAQDESLTHTMCLEMVDCLFSDQYDASEAAYALTEDTVAIAGKVYYTLSGTTYTALVEGTDWNAGDPVPAASWYEANLSGRDYGSNNPVQNNQIQWLNSSGATGNWFTKQTIWDTCSTTLLNKNGFCMNLDPLFLAVVKPAKLTTALCSAEGGGSVTHYARFWSLSLTQIFGTANNGITENVQLDYYKNGGDKKKTLKDSTSYTTWWLRSPLTGFASAVYLVRPSGASTDYYATNAFGFSLACIIA